MKIAILFWGLTRSLKYTIKSIKINVFNVLQENNIDFDIYLHTYKLNKPFNNHRTRERNIKLNFNEYKLLEPDFFIYDELDTIKKKLNLEQYRTHPDPWHSKYNSVDNFILAMYSKFRITTLMEENIKNQKINKPNKTKESIKNRLVFLDKDMNHLIKKKAEYLETKQMLKASKIDPKVDRIKRLKRVQIKLLENFKDNINESTIYKKYDYYLFLRPDVKYINKFNIDFFDLIDDKNICIPNFCIYGNFNDRMYMSNYKNALIYGKLFNELLDYSKKKNYIQNHFIIK